MNRVVYLLRRADLLPKLIPSLRGYNYQTFRRDLSAGITVGLVALPLALAFAIASGVPPQSGLYCAIIAGLVGSSLGGSRLQISGPTGAFVVVVSGIVSQYGLDGLFTCTLMAGVMLILMGLTGLGNTIQYLPRPLITGFTNGIAVLIASTQIRDFFGLQIATMPSDFLHKMQAISEAWPSINPQATSLAVASLTALIVFGRWYRHIPGVLVVMLVGTLITASFGLSVETVGSRFGGIPSGLPKLSVPDLQPSLVLKLLAPAITVALLGAIESLLSAVVADRMTHDKHSPNAELVAQGIVNVLSPLAGGLPATGAIARTATNIRAGAQTPVSGIIHSLTLLIVLLFASSLAKYIPLCLLASILFLVAYNMGEWREIPKILRLSPADILVWAITFGLTVLADLTVAVETGVILAALLYIRRVTTTTSVSRITQTDIVQAGEHALTGCEIPDDVALYRIHGPFLFGCTEKLSKIRDALESLPTVVILRLRNMTAVDGTGLGAIEDLAAELRGAGRTLILCGLRQQPAKFLHRAGFEEIIGKENICPHIKAALIRADEVIGRGKGSQEPFSESLEAQAAEVCHPPQVGAKLS